MDALAQWLAAPYGTTFSGGSSRPATKEELEAENT